MTTIAYRSGVLAADGRMTAGGNIVTDKLEKIFDVSDRGYTVLGEKVLAYGLAGYLRAKLVLEYCMEEGLKVTSSIDTDDQFSAIIVCEKRTFVVSKDEESAQLDFIEVPDGIPTAVGSGRVIATHVLQDDKADPLDAVVAAMKSDVGSGGETMRWTKS